MPSVKAILQISWNLISKLNGLSPWNSPPYWNILIVLFNNKWTGELCPKNSETLEGQVSTEVNNYFLRRAKITFISFEGRRGGGLSKFQRSAEWWWPLSSFLESYHFTLYLFNQMQVYRHILCSKNPSKGTQRWMESTHIHSRCQFFGVLTMAAHGVFAPGKHLLNFHNNERERENYYCMRKWSSIGFYFLSMRCLHVVVIITPPVLCLILYLLSVPLRSQEVPLD